MSYVNCYKAPPKVTETPTYDDGPLDLNFYMPIPEVLESERVKLVPFVPAVFANQYLTAVSDYPHLYDYHVYGPFHSSDPAEFYLWFEERMRTDPAVLPFAIIDKTKPAPETHPDQGGQLAGVLTYLRTEPQNLATEIGHLVIFPPFQRTHVTTNAVGLLLIHALEVPEKGGWGMRRVQWTAAPNNKPSIKAAERMGFKWEGILRNVRPMPGEREDLRKYKGEPRGLKPSARLAVLDRKGDPLPGVPSWDTAFLSLCWDDYDRSEVERLMTRTS
ncbi:hypothetical protein M407DRAFT_82917 [Tulasnella calospora MUT 4182]|uniref:N-acetyltransferase domain-containing protein n=1 Tax=Tulasnella calospora MUT 4182 TaxID=1051891 RepID=A0A0C3LD35_9AGAM|nr:hypothetical protein M407DRAFT_82917 [Tulasnella calospora MUT 4182]